MITTFLLALILSLAPPKNSKWEYQFEKQGVKVYTKEVPGSSFKAFKGEAVFNINSQIIVEQISDIESFPEWCYRTTSVQIIKREQSKVYYRYVSATPPIIKNREAYMFNEILPNDHNGNIVIQIGTFTSNEPVPSGYIRMPYSKGYWKLTPVSENKTFVSFEVQADPGGIIPSWLANMTASDAPWITMTNLRKFILKKQE